MLLEFLMSTSASATGRHGLTCLLHATEQARYCYHRPKAMIPSAADAGERRVMGRASEHFARDAVDSPPRTSSEGSSSTATLSDRVGGGSGTPSGASANGCSPPAAGQPIGGNSPEPRVLGSLPTAIPGKVAPRNHAIKAACAAATGAGAKPVANGAADDDIERNEAWR